VSYYIINDKGDICGESIDQFDHACSRIGGVFAVGEALDEFRKGLIRFAVGFRVAVGPVLRGKLVQERLIFVEQYQTAQV